VNDFLELAHQQIRAFGNAERRHRIVPEVSARTIRKHLHEVYGDFSRAVPASELVDDAARMLREWNLHITHPRYFGLFNPSVLPAAIAGDALVAAYNPQLAAWSHAPAANEIERYTLGYFAERLGLPAHTAAHFTSGGAEANHSALVVALASRHADHSERGLVGSGARPMVYASRESHHSFDKVVRAVGLGRRSLRTVAVDEQLRMDVAELANRVAADRAAGRKPLVVVATAGTTGAGAIDPLPEIAELCSQEELWLHVDAAWGGAACLSSHLRPLLGGIERADSVTWDAHKYLSVPMGAGMFFCTEPAGVREAFEARTPYMPQPTEDTFDPYSASMQWSRRHIGLKVFMALAALGARGYEELIEHQAAMGDLLRAQLREHGWTVVCPSELPIVCFTKASLESGATHAAQLAARLAEENFWISPVRLAGREPVLRACITSYATERSDVEALVEAVTRCEREWVRQA
jgi:glutamate/tyrosine decarboxylase-like PLP-dependent enzyme